MSKSYKMQVLVRLKPGVLDVQGKAVEASLRRDGCASVGDIRIGKLIELEVRAGSESAAREEVAALCNKLLVNTIIEDFDIRASP
jgi:phosphoribosylformylglycinamidine synthase